MTDTVLARRGGTARSNNRDTGEPVTDLNAITAGPILHGEPELAVAATAFTDVAGCQQLR